MADLAKAPAYGNAHERTEARHHPAPDTTEAKPHILFADDDDEMRDYVKSLLEAAGYEVEAVENGRAALNLLKAGLRPDLVLTDVMMPDLDGFGLLTALRIDPKLEDLLVILLSARGSEEARIQGLAAGADDYLVKPFSARELRARVDGAIRLARQRREAARREQELRAQIDVERSKAVLRQTENQLEFALSAGRLGSWALDVVSGRIDASDICREHFGVAPGEPFDTYAHVLAHVHPDDRDRRQAAVDHAIASGEDLEVEFRTVSSTGRIEWILLQGRATYKDGRRQRAAGVSLNITARKAAEERQRLLLDELNHRVKNTLATVQSIAIMTRRTVERPEAFNEAFTGRIHALAHAHDLLTTVSWQGAALEEVVQRTVAPYLSGVEINRVGFSGPAIRLGPNATITLNMAFHELTTNAVKYGALSDAYGRVDVDWSIDVAAETISIHWRESGGPPVKAPTRRGFGTRLIEQGLPHEMGGQAQLSFVPEGLHCHIRLPLSAKFDLPV